MPLSFQTHTNRGSHRGMQQRKDDRIFSQGWQFQGNLKIEEGSALQLKRGMAYRCEGRIKAGGEGGESE